jgi:hypothetical protein
MKYIRILPITGYTSKDRCEAINKELYAIKRPYSVRSEKDVTNKVFKETQFTDGTWGMEVDLDYVFRVHKDRNIEPLAALFPELTEQERGGLVSFIESNDSFHFKYIIPANVKKYTKAELIEEGLLTE